MGMAKLGKESAPNLLGMSRRCQSYCVPGNIWLSTNPLLDELVITLTALRSVTSSKRMRLPLMHSRAVKVRLCWIGVADCFIKTVDLLSVEEQHKLRKVGRSETRLNSFSPPSPSGIALS